jgi:hypothetical protein
LLQRTLRITPPRTTPALPQRISWNKHHGLPKTCRTTRKTRTHATLKAKPWPKTLRGLDDAVDDSLSRLREALDLLGRQMTAPQPEDEAATSGDSASDVRLAG